MKISLRNESGAVYVEFAIIVPVLIAFIVGTIGIGTSLYAKLTLSSATVDAVRIAADFHEGRDDAWTPGNENARKSADVAGLIIGRFSSPWAAETGEYVEGLGYRQVSIAGDKSDCALDRMPDVSGFNLIQGERLAIARSCLKADFIPTIKGPGWRFTETAILPMKTPLPMSCKEIADSGETRNGIYTIDPDATGPIGPIQVRCDIIGGGWTMVAAAFEDAPEADWNAGTGASYDPTLDNGQSFALSSDEIPPHSETAFGLNDNATSIVALPFAYTTGDLDIFHMEGSDGSTYDVYRSATETHPALDPESGPTAPAALDSVNCLIVDRTGGEGFDWAYCPNATSSAARGAAYGGSDRSMSSEPSAWTVWVR
jgi:Flp pilus assembly pilin Flp